MSVLLPLPLAGCLATSDVLRADMDVGSIVALVVVALSVLSSFFKKRNTPEEWPTTPPIEGQAPSVPARLPAPGPPPAAPKSVNWEQELRRLLGEEPEPSATPPPLATPLPTPTLQRDSRVPPATPVPPAPKPLPAPAPLARPKRTSVPMIESPHDDSYAPSVLAQLKESAGAHQRAMDIDAGVTARLQRADERTTKHMPVLPKRRLARPAETVQALALLRHPLSARQAIISSVILGPPKAFEDR